MTANQEGTGQNLQLAVSPASQTVSGAGVLAARNVAVNFNCSAANPCPTADGSELVGNIQFGGSNELNTSVKVMVKVKLVHPRQCLSFYNFVTDQEYTTTVTSTDVGVVQSGKNAGKVTSTMPFGQLSSNVLVVNNCSTAQRFDVDVNLDPAFDTNPNNNPGNAVFAYTGSANVDADNFNIASFGEGTPHGQTLCLRDVVVGGNQSFLATAHMGIRRGMPRSELPAGGFLFTAGLTEAGSGCTGASLGSAGSQVNYTVK